MRIWIENPFDNLPLEGFRPQRYWLMAEAFSKAGCDVVLWTADFNHTTKGKRVLREQKAQPFALRLVEEPAYGGNVSLCRMYAHWRYARNWRREAEAFAEEHGAPDAIIVSTPPLSTGCTARRLAARFGAKLVFDVMDAWPETFERIVPRWMLWPLRNIARANYLGADLITVVADRYAGLVREYGYTGKVERHYHGIDISGAPPRIVSDGARLRLAYVGNLGRTYDLATVVRALAEIPDATLDVAGKGDGEARLRALVSELKLENRVTLHGYLDGREMVEMLAGCNVGVVPMDDSSCVGVPYKFCDYAKAGVAIVSSLGGESAALLAKHGAGAVYRHGDHASLARVLRSLDAAKAGANARRMAETTLDSSVIYAAYVQSVLNIA